MGAVGVTIGIIFALIVAVRLIFYFANRSADKPLQHQHYPHQGQAAPTLGDEALIRLDLGKLDKVSPRLGDSVIRHILIGDADSALLTLGKHATAAANALHDGGYYGGWVSGRHDYLLGARDWKPDVARRYGEVLAVIYPPTAWERLPGSDKAPMWFRRLLRQYGQGRQTLENRHHGWKTRPSQRTKSPWTIDQLRSMLGDDIGPIVDAAFTTHEGYGGRYKDEASPEHMPGFWEFIAEDPTRRVEELKPLPAKGRARALQMLAQRKMTGEPWFGFAFQQASDSAKTVREAAGALLRAAGPDLLEARVREAWPTLKAGQKTALASAVGASKTGGALLAELAEGETNATVLADLKRRLNQDVALPAAAADGPVDGPEGYTALDATRISSPPAPALPEDKPVSPELSSLIHEAHDRWRDECQRHNRENAGKPHFYRHNPPGTEIARMLIEVMDGKRQPADGTRQHQLLEAWNLPKSIVAYRERILSHPDLTVWHLARAHGKGDGNNQYRTLAHLAFHATPVGGAVRARLSPGQDLRVFADIVNVIGNSPEGPAQHMLGERYYRADLEDWPPGSIWPYLLRHLPILDAALGLTPRGDAERRELAAMKLLTHFPATPARYAKVLLDLALGDGKSMQAPARALLASTPGLGGLLAPLLEHPKSESRAGAARWIADLNDPAAIPDLLKAARKEKSDAARAAMLSAIARLGGDIGEFVSVKALLGEAEAGLKKAPTKGLEWFPFDGLPVVHTRDGAALDPTVVRWWVALAVKLKQPGGNPWFDLLLDLLDEKDAAKLGLAVMQSWVAHDTLAPDEAEANAYAEANVDSLVAQYKRWQPDVKRETLFAQLRQQKLTSYFGSGNDQKGVLALSVRAGGADAVAIVRAYFRDHYTRTAQCKALIECLAANPSPLAIQFVLSISRRWRTRGVKELAGVLIEGVAERSGWTAEQLADRTIPTAGFDERGLLDLPIGDRVYQARIDGQGRIDLFNPDGKTVQNLPSSVAGPAAADLTEAKSLLSAAKKESRQVWDFQSRRLYEALCVERAWPVEEWSEYILAHPIVGRMAQRLIWEGVNGEGKRLALFRPMEDLSLTDAADAAVSPSIFATVRLAHASGMTQAEVAAWRAHFGDYEVAPLFDQIGRPVLAARDANETGIDDRKGWMIETFKLRGMASKLGYTRGTPEDGGWFYTYEKSFDALKVTAVIEFTGNGVPEENRPGALVALRFVRNRQRRGWGDGSGMALKEVPAILVSEAWNDFHTMAAAGSGFDPEWSKASAW